MTKILKFPEQKKIVVNSLRQRVFYIGYRYIGFDGKKIFLKDLDNQP